MSYLVEFILLALLTMKSLLLFRIWRQSNTAQRITQVLYVVGLGMVSTMLFLSELLLLPVLPKPWHSNNLMAALRFPYIIMLLGVIFVISGALSEYRSKRTETTTQ